MRLLGKAEVSSRPAAESVIPALPSAVPSATPKQAPPTVKSTAAGMRRSCRKVRDDEHRESFSVEALDPCLDRAERGRAHQVGTHAAADDKGDDDEDEHRGKGNRRSMAVMHAIDKSTQRHKLTATSVAIARPNVAIGSPTAMG